jgi:phosphohistidine phosphatase
MGADQGSRRRATKTLYVLRHAKSSWDDPDLDDHERPLARRGRRTAEMLAEYIRAKDIEPDLVLCSSSRRTRETLDAVTPSGQWAIEDELYGADASDIIERLHRVPEEIASLMVIGHNPTMQDLVLRLVDETDGPLDEIRRKFPTGALATLTFDTGWSALGAGRAQLRSFIRPKQLSRA